MKSSSLFRKILPLFIIIAACVLAAVMIMTRKPPEKEVSEEKAFLVEAQQVFPENIAFQVRSQGNVLPQHQTRVSAQISGVVKYVSETFVQGGFVKKGEILLELESDDYETEVKLAESQLAQAKAALEEEIARGQVAEVEWRSVNKSAPPALGLRKPQLAREKANVLGAEANLDRAKRNLSRTKIKAPYNALIVSRDVDLGQFIPIGSIVGEVYATDVAEIRLPLTNSDLPFIQFDQAVNQNYPVTVAADVAGQVQTWRAELVRSEGVMDAGSRVLFAVAHVKDPYQLSNDGSEHSPLRFGQFVSAVIEANEAANMFVLPRELLRFDNTVITVDKERKLQIKAVDVARTDAKNVYIQSGLKSGDMVATSAIPNAFNGMQVRLPSDQPEVDIPSRYDQKDDESKLDTEGN